MQRLVAITFYFQSEINSTYSLFINITSIEINHQYKTHLKIIPRTAPPNTPDIVSKGKRLCFRKPFTPPLLSDERSMSTAANEPFVGEPCVELSDAAARWVDCWALLLLPCLRWASGLLPLSPTEGSKPGDNLDAVVVVGLPLGEFHTTVWCCWTVCETVGGLDEGWIVVGEIWVVVVVLLPVGPAAWHAVVDGLEKIKQCCNYYWLHSVSYLLLLLLLRINKSSGIFGHLLQVHLPSLKWKKPIEENGDACS